MGGRRNPASLNLIVRPIPMRDAHWLCLDCSKDTYDEYYSVRNHIWRRAVEKSQRHGMLCLSCLERRLGRPLRSQDFISAPVNDCVSRFLNQRQTSDNAHAPAKEALQSGEEFDDSPMAWDDYGLIAELTDNKLREIDAALVSLTTVKPVKVASIIGRTISSSPAHVPGLPDFFYLERMRLLVESGALKLVGNMSDLMKCEICLP